MEYADKMRTIALKIKEEKMARMRYAALTYINDIIMPAITQNAHEGKFVLNLELDFTGITLKEAIEEWLNKRGYKISIVGVQYLTIEW
jgi:hypothetical protein